MATSIQMSATLSSVLLTPARPRSLQADVLIPNDTRQIDKLAHYPPSSLLLCIPHSLYLVLERSNSLFTAHYFLFLTQRPFACCACFFALASSSFVHVLQRLPCLLGCDVILWKTWHSFSQYMYSFPRLWLQFLLIPYAM